MRPRVVRRSPRRASACALGCLRQFFGFGISSAAQTLEEREVKYAIRLPANANLERNISELLKRPVGRPSRKPLVRYKSFLYQAAS